MYQTPGLKLGLLGFILVPIVILRLILKKSWRGLRKLILMVVRPG